jgi:hypothetical protein
MALIGLIMLLTLPLLAVASTAAAAIYIPKRSDSHRRRIGHISGR